MSFDPTRDVFGIAGWPRWEAFLTRVSELFGPLEPDIDALACLYASYLTKAERDRLWDWSHPYAPLEMFDAPRVEVPPCASMLGDHVLQLVTALAQWCGITLESVGGGEEMWESVEVELECAVPDALLLLDEMTRFFPIPGALPLDVLRSLRRQHSAVTGLSEGPVPVGPFAGEAILVWEWRRLKQRRVPTAQAARFLMRRIGPPRPIRIPLSGYERFLRRMKAPVRVTVERALLPPEACVSAPFQELANRLWRGEDHPPPGRG